MSDDSPELKTKRQKIEQALAAAEPPETILALIYELDDMNARFDYFEAFLTAVATSNVGQVQLDRLRAMATDKERVVFRGILAKHYDGQLALRRCELRHAEAFTALYVYEQSHHGASAASRLELDPLKAALAATVAPLLHQYRADRVLYEALLDRVKLWVRRVHGLTSNDEDLVLQAQVDAAQAAGSVTGQVVTFTDPEPAAEPVDGAVLLDDLLALINRFVVVAKEASHAAVLWVLFTWTFEAFSIAPYLTLQSPLKRCGKTRLMILLKWLARRSLLISNTSPAPIFRLVAQYQPTMLFDEVDTFFDLHDELQNILNAGHHKESAYVLRCVGEDNAAQTFSVYSPKALALIGSGLPGTVLDRSIVIPMRRKAKSEARERLGQRSYRKLKAEIEPLLRRCMRWAQDHATVLQDAEPMLPESLNDRAQDNWEPLLAIADTIGGLWPDRARAAAAVLSGEAADEGDDTPAFKLLSDIQAIFAAKPGETFFPTRTLLSHLRDVQESPWGSWGKRGDPLGDEQLARLLRPFKLKSKQVRQPQGILRGYLTRDFAAVFTLYLAEPHSNPLHPLPPQDSADLGAVSDPLPDPAVTGSKSDVTSSNSTPVTGVTGSMGVNGGDPQHPRPTRTPIQAPPEQ